MNTLTRAGVFVEVSSRSIDVCVAVVPVRASGDRQVPIACLNGWGNPRGNSGMAKLAVVALPTFPFGFLLIRVGPLGFANPIENRALPKPDRSPELDPP